MCQRLFIVSHSSDLNCESHFGRTAIQKFIEKNGSDFYSALAIGPLNSFAVGASFTDKGEEPDIMNEQPDEDPQRGIYVSSAYGQVRKSLASANHFKSLMSELNLQRENEVPGSIMFIPPAFEENMSKGDAREFCRRWTLKGPRLPIWCVQVTLRLWASKKLSRNNSVDYFATCSRR